MILISQDGFKAFNMAYIRSYFIYEDKFGKLPTLSETDEYHKYAIWIDPNPCWENKSLYTVGTFEKLKDAQKVFTKITSIINPAAEGVIMVGDTDVSFFGKDSPMWRDIQNADNQE